MKASRRGGLLAGVLVAGAVVSTTLVWTPLPARAEATGGSASAVVVVGVPGLRWEDVSRTGTPTLWWLAGSAAVGSLSVRAATSVTCPADGWTTLGAGNRAEGPARSERCPAPRPVTRGDLVETIRRNASEDFGAEVGALGTAVRRSGRCVHTVGPLAGLATDGLPSYATDAGRCSLTLVDLPPVGGARAPGAAAADARVARIVAPLGPEVLLLVVGLSETDGEAPHLHVVLARGPGFAAGTRLDSPTTRRRPFVQLIDVAPTVLRALRLPVPDSMSGRPIRAGGPAHPVATTVRDLVDLDRAAQVHRRLVPPFFAVLVLGQALLYLAVAAVLHRLRSGGSRGRVLAATRVAATAGAAVPAATYLANLVPWWRADHPLPVLLTAIGVATAALVGLAFAGPWRRAMTGPPAAVATITALVLAADVVTGARLQLSSLAGYSPLVAGRFAGIGNVAFAVFATAALLAAAALTEGRGSAQAVAVVAAVGVVAVAVDGSPAWGDDFGGVLALIPGFAVLALSVAGRRVTARRLLAVLGLAVLVVLAFSLADYARPADHQTHLGRFVGQVLHGGAWTVVERKARSNLALLTHSVLTLLVPLAVALLTAVLLRPWGGLRRAFADAPALRHGFVAVLVMGVIGFLVNDSGVAIPALAMTVAIPIAIAAATESLRRAVGSATPTAVHDPVLP